MSAEDERGPTVDDGTPVAGTGADGSGPNTGPAARRRLLAACFVGNFVEYYDFAIYGYTAAVIATSFFPSGDRTAALLSTFALFAVSFFMRPVGGIVFGNLGDRLGRRNILATTILLMGVSTVAVGVLPTYGQIGLWAPVLLTLTRLLQGFSAGGEITGASTFVVENAPADRRGLWIGIVTLGTVVSFSIAALTLLGLRAAMSAESYASWGWRLPFLLGGVIALVGLYLRLRLEESPVFRELAQGHRTATTPFLELLRRHRRAVGLSFAISSFSGLAFYIIGTYFTSHLTEVVGLDPTGALVSTGITLFLTSIVIVVAGAVSDRVGRKPMLVGGALWLALTSGPAFLLADAGGGIGGALGAQLLMVPGLGMFVSALIVILVEMFPTRVRYSGGALGYNLGYALFGGTGPFVSAFLIAETGSAAAPGFYVTVAAILVLPVVVFGIRDTAHRPLASDDDDPRTTGDAADDELLRRRR